MALRTSRSSCIVYAPSLVSTSGACHGKFKLRRSQGYPKDLKRAFGLYKRCGLPYAHYRVGEFYENGWGTERNLDEAKRYYRLAYKERHALAVKKLEIFDFLH